jgi:hypothetical protein
MPSLGGVLWGCSSLSNFLVMVGHVLVCCPVFFYLGLVGEVFNGIVV